MSKIREILTPMLIESRKQSEREWMMVRVVQAVGQIDINLDLMRQCVQSLLDDCQSVLNRQSIGVSYRHEWEGISLNAVRDIKQRAGVMLRLLDGEVVV